MPAAEEEVQRYARLVQTRPLGHVATWRALATENGAH